MTYALALPASSPNQVIVDAIRCWRAERDRGLSAQPSLYAILARHGCEILSPVLDSLMTLYEAALGRKITAGGSERLSDDETMVIEMLRGASPATLSDNATRTLDGAVRSTRIMMKMALGQVWPRAAIG